jgi:iron-regulated transporter 1
MGRLTALKIALSVKVISVTLGYLACARLLFNPDYSYSEGAIDVTLYSIPLFCAVANLSFAMVAMGVQKDWIVVLSAGSKDWLVSMNSIMTQIDLASKSMAPAFTGIVFASFSYGYSAVIMMSLNALVTVIFYAFLSRIFSAFPALWTRNSGGAESARVQKSTSQQLATEDSEAAENPSPDNFFTSGCAATMFAYAILYFTVLSFGSLMTVYLRSAAAC